MSRIAKNAAHVSWDSVKQAFRVAKRVNGEGDYIIYTPHAYNCYGLAMDMARDNGRNVIITAEAARMMRDAAFTVDGEWTVN